MAQHDINDGTENQGDGGRPPVKIADKLEDLPNNHDDDGDRQNATTTGIIMDEDDDAVENQDSPAGKLLKTFDEIATTAPSFRDEDTVCGIGCFKPKWLQMFASKKLFVVVYALSGMVQFMLSAYYIGTLSTLEKSFKMSSRMSGLISSSWDVGGLITNISLTYIAAKGHRTRWVALGLFVSGTTCFMRVLPYLIYGPGEDIKLYTVEYGHKFNNDTIDAVSVANDAANTSKVDIIRTSDNCNVNELANSFSVIMFLLSHAILGMGTSVYWTCGAAYLDDNARKNIVPALLAIVQTIRLFGPTIGFLLSFYALEIFVDPYLTPTITSKDPRWIGAWWLGWYPIGFGCMTLAFCLALFPKALPRAVVRRKRLTSVPPAEKSLADFKNSVKRILTNKIIIFNSFSSVCFTMGFMAYWNFMPKYMETQFRMTASQSSFLTGTVGILFNALGVLVAGLVISKFRPSARKLAGWNVFVEMLDVVGHASYVLLSCPEQKLAGRWNEDSSWNITMPCNANFSCGLDIQYAPVCDLKREMAYYSPCHAGCSYSTILNGTKMYGGCACVPGDKLVANGPCPVDCSTSITVFIVVMGVLSFTSATGRSANTLIQFRSVAEEDKSLSIGITEALLSLLAFFPSPILYGIIVDWTCLVWGDDCGARGNCWLYDAFKLRYIFNLSATAFILMGTLLDMFVWYYSKGLKIYDEDFETEDDDKFEDKNKISKK